MCNSVYCAKCVLKSNNPGIDLDEKGLCNICNGAEFNTFYNNMQSSAQYHNKFKSDMKSESKKWKYDCLVMLSGGKDSINILHKMAKEEKLKVLAFTVNLPFESPKSKENIENVISILDVDHMVFTPSANSYKEMMRAIFLLRQGGEALNIDNLSKYKQLSPCVVCTSYIKILTCFIAEKFRIPYVLYCADPGQMANLPINIGNTVKSFKSVFEVDFINKLFNDDIDKLDISKNINAPTVIYPYIAMPDYNADKIIAKLRALGLYDSTPQEGHCKLWSLLNYNAIKRYDSPFYILDYALDVRSGKMGRDETIQFIELFKKLMLKIGESSIDEKDELLLKNILHNVFTTKGEFEYAYNNILKMHDIAAQLGIDLREIKSNE